MEDDITSPAATPMLSPIQMGTQLTPRSTPASQNNTPVLMTPIAPTVLRSNSFREFIFLVPIGPPVPATPIDPSEIFCCEFLRFEKKKRKEIKRREKRKEKNRNKRREEKEKNGKKREKSEKTCTNITGSIQDHHQKSNVTSSFSR